MGIDSSTPLPQEVTTLIKITATWMQGKYRFTESDMADIEQAISLEVVRRRTKFDAARAKEYTFLARLVEHAASDIITGRLAGSRDFRREEGSLDQWVKDDTDSWVRRVETVSQDAAARRVGPPEMWQNHGQDLAIDLAEAVSKLSPRLRKVFDHYVELGSARKVAIATGLHHSSVCESVQQIRAHFENAGLADYLPKRPANPTVSPRAGK